MANFKHAQGLDKLKCSGVKKIQKLIRSLFPSQVHFSMNAEVFHGHQK